MTTSSAMIASHRRIPTVSACGVVLSIVALAWVAVALAAWPGSEEHAMTGHAAHHAATAVRAYPWSVGWVTMWILMVVAMMWPLALPIVSAIDKASFRRWRVALLLGGLGAFTALWLLAGLAVASVARLTNVPEHSRGWQLACMVLAVAVLGSARRTRLLWRCAQFSPIAPAGRRGLATSARAALVSWRRCALLCGPVMTAMVVGHSSVVMICGAAASWWEATHRRAWKDRVPVMLMAAGAGWLAVAIGVSGHG